MIIRAIRQYSPGKQGVNPTMRRFNLMVMVLFSVLLFTEGAALSANSFDPNVSWWKGENNATDSIGSNNGTLHGGITFAAGRVGQAFSFDGSTAQYVSIPSTASLNIFGTHTVAFWVKPNALPTSGNVYQLVSKWTNGYEHKQVSINANGTVTYFLYGTTASSGVTSTTALQPGVWCHVAATYDGANMKIYINGLQDVSTAATGDVGDSSGTLYLGYNPDTAAFAGGEAYFNGLLDEVGWYDKALSATEVANLKSGQIIQIPQTGQTTCYDAGGTAIPCAGTGQDGEKLAGALWPSPRFTDNSIAATDDKTVTDNLTGLTWTKDGNISGQKNWQEALDYIVSLNSGNYLGHNDWRLPNRQ